MQFSTIIFLDMMVTVIHENCSLVAANFNVSIRNGQGNLGLYNLSYLQKVFEKKKLKLGSFSGDLSP